MSYFIIVWLYMKWMCKKHWLTVNSLIICPRIDKFFTFFPSFFLSVGCQLATFFENILVAKYIFHLTWGPLNGCSLKHCHVVGDVLPPCKCKFLLKLRLDVVLRITQLISRQLETTIHWQTRRTFFKPHISEMNLKNIRLGEEYPLVYKCTDRVNPLQ